MGYSSNGMSNGPRQMYVQRIRGHRRMASLAGPGLPPAASAGPSQPGLSARPRRRRRRRYRLASYATFCILFAKSRPEVGGGNALPSFR